MRWVCVIVVAGSFAISLVATRVVRAIALRRGYVDRPGGHKSHDRPVALGGGIAVVFTVCGALLTAVVGASAAVRYGVPDWLPEFLRIHVEGVAFKTPQVLAVVGGALVLHVVGLIDDSRPLGPGVKLLVQVLVAVVLAGVFGIRLLELERWPTWMPVGLTVLWIVVITNAFNFLDNMDGLAAGVAAVTGTIFALAAIGAGQIFVPVVVLILVGAVLGFLVFNFHPASIYLGDAGSLVIGYFLAVLVVLTTFYDPSRELRPAGVLLPLVALAVPLYDVISVVMHRLRAGESIFRGDRRHFSHRLQRRGLSVRASVLTIYLATAATSAGAVILPHVEWWAAGLIFAQTLFVLLIIAVLEHTGGRAGAE